MNRGTVLSVLHFCIYPRVRRTFPEVYGIAGGLVVVSN